MAQCGRRKGAKFLRHMKTYRVAINKPHLCWDSVNMAWETKRMWWLSSFLSSHEDVQGGNWEVCFEQHSNNIKWKWDEVKKNSFVLAHNGYGLRKKGNYVMKEPKLLGLTWSTGCQLKRVSQVIVTCLKTFPYTVSSGLFQTGWRREIKSHLMSQLEKLIYFRHISEREKSVK